jgi:hypothetical protein
MVTDILRRLGLFIGWDLEKYNEARFFQYRNERILNACNGGWDNPTVIEPLLSHKDVYERVRKILHRDLTSFAAISYLGPANFIRYRSVFRLTIPWGWKDPRNTFLLPLWLDIFPEAKIVHVFRNGIDVAQSLHNRERARIQNVLRRNKHFSKAIPSQINSIRDNGLVLTLTRNVRNALGKTRTPLYELKRHRVHSCISIDRGFQLWRTYVKTAFENLENNSNPAINLKYEDILAEPEKHIVELRAFCGLDHKNIRIETILPIIRNERRYAFKKYESMIGFYGTVKDDFWMQKLGYSTL